MKSLPAPPVLPVVPERFALSPSKITRQHIPQLSKQPTFSLSVVKDSGDNCANFAYKKTLQSNKENKEQQQKQDKEKFKKAKKHNSEKNLLLPLS